ncbi:hypothetical protein GGI23_002468 [Coemansia sp. RSA 2559]|nr:hypothetical protein GGI23_002468 [Coemansia sp. RSA 2559]
MAHLSEGTDAARSLGGTDNQNPKRQSRFQSHWDATSNQLSHMQLQTATSQIAQSNSHQDYEWDSLVASSNDTPSTANGLQGLQKLGGSIDDDWSDILNQVRYFHLCR